MRMKKTTSRFAFKLDKLFWFLVFILPIISWCLYLFSFNGYGESQASLYSFWLWMSNQFVGSNGNSNVVYVTLDSIFGQSGVLPFFGQSVLLFVTYLVNVEIIHVFFDVIVFIPRLAHKWISKAVQDD